MSNSDNSPALFEIYSQRDGRFCFRKKVNMEVTAGMFTDLVKELGHMSNIDGLAAMSGYDMLGREFTVLPDELDAYIANTQRVLNSTKDTKGKIVGLAIDCEDHNHEGGAGWIVALERAADRDIIIFTIEWTDEGLALVGGNIRRYFSATFDTDAKLILGGSLTNWPGSRKPNGQYLLRPVELSRSMRFLQKEKEMTVETAQETKPAWALTLETAISELSARFSPKKPDNKPEPTAQSVAELMQSPEAVMEMARRAEEIAANKNAVYARQQHVIQLAADIVGGTPSRPLGLAGIRSDEIVELLMGLPMPQSLAVEKIICKLTDALTVDFREMGSGGTNFNRKPKIAPEYREAIKIWVNEGKSLSAFFAQVAPELGKAEDYNLTEFVAEGK